MDNFEYKNLSTSEKIQLVEEIWDSISEDKLSLSKETKSLLDERIESLNKPSKRTSWDSIKKKARNKSR